MELKHITFRGPEVDDFEIFDRLPRDFGKILGSLNGFIQFGGGLHVRGACLSPNWHSLRHVWIGPEAFHRQYSSVDPHWIPFGEDCVGDQFFLVNKDVLRLSAETGDIDPFDLDLADFLDHANANPIEFLSLEPLLQFQNEQGDLEPGQLIFAYPPFCTAEAANGVSLKAVPSEELQLFHSNLASELPKEGEKFRVEVTE